MKNKSYYKKTEQDIYIDGRFYRQQFGIDFEDEEEMKKFLKEDCHAYISVPDDYIMEEPVKENYDSDLQLEMDKATFENYSYNINANVLTVERKEPPLQEEHIFVPCEINTTQVTENNPYLEKYEDIMKLPTFQAMMKDCYIALEHDEKQTYVCVLNKDMEFYYFTEEWLDNQMAKHLNFDMKAYKEEFYNREIEKPFENMTDKDMENYKLDMIINKLAEKDTGLTIAEHEEFKKYLSQFEPCSVDGYDFYKTDYGTIIDTSNGRWHGGYAVVLTDENGNAYTNAQVTKSHPTNLTPKYENLGDVLSKQFDLDLNGNKIDRIPGIIQNIEKNEQWTWTHQENEKLLDYLNKIDSNPVILKDRQYEAKIYHTEYGNIIDLGENRLVYNRFAIAHQENDTYTSLNTVSYKTLKSSGTYDFQGFFETQFGTDLNGNKLENTTTAEKHDPAAILNNAREEKALEDDISKIYDKVEKQENDKDDELDR